MARIRCYENNAQRQKAHRDKIKQENDFNRGLADVARQIAASVRYCERNGVTITGNSTEVTDHETLIRVSDYFLKLAVASRKEDHSQVKPKARKVRKETGSRTDSASESARDMDKQGEPLRRSLRRVRKGNDLADVSHTKCPVFGS